MSKSKETMVKLDGYVVHLKDGEQVPHEPFMDEFIDFLTSRGLGWTGFSKQVNEDGEEIENIKE